MSVQASIEQKLSEAIELDHLEVLNESGNHNVPANSETHFKVTTVSKQFEGMSLIARHRKVNEILAEELAGPVHALSIHAYTEEDWRRRNGEAPMSPPCLN